MFVVLTFVIEGRIMKIVLHDLGLLFEGYNIFYTSETVTVSAKCVGDICEFWHLPSYGVIAKIVLHDLDLLFEGHILRFYISETVRASAKNMRKKFVDFDICHRMVSLRNLYSVTLINILNITPFKFFISETLRASAEMCGSLL